MGNSCLEYMGKRKFVSDFEIEVVTNAILDCLNEFQNSSEESYQDRNTAFFEADWRYVMKTPLNGLINLRFDKFFPERDDGEFLVNLIRFARDKFVGTDDFVGQDKFDEIFPYEVTLADGGLPAEKIEAYFNKISCFIRGAISEQSRDKGL